MARDTRSRMIQGAARMVGTRGAGRTSLRELAKEAGVPLGSTYHHFPEGKHQLIEEAVRAIGGHITRMIESGREDGASAALEALSSEWRVVLERSDFRTGCAVLAVATEDDPELAAVAREVFATWEARLAEVLRESGVPAERAPRLARVVVAAVEGGVALCRAERSITPLDDVVTELRLVLASAAGPATGDQ